MEIETKTIHILLVEDDQDDYLILHESLKELANHANYELDWVQTYQAGLLQMLNGSHDIYLIDHYLGEHSGLDLLNEAMQAGCQAPVIMITGLADRKIDQAALQAGATDYLVKGQLDGKSLERSIRYALERNRLLQKIHELAVRDALTGIFNRRELHRFLEYEMIKTRRYKHPFSLLIVDIDKFKDINDRYGHRFGDELLHRVAQVLLKNIRGCDLLARYGGDEFIVILPETPAFNGCQGAERLRKIVEDLSYEGNLDQPGKVNVTLSIGVAEFPGDADSRDMLIEAADRALFQAKQQGRNQVVRFHAGREKEPGLL